MSSPEWLRPISERFLDAEPGRPPWTVWLATVLCAASALISTGILVVWAAQTVRFVRDPAGAVDWLNAVVAAGVTAAGAVLCAVLAPGTVLLVRRGRVRGLAPAGAALGSLAAVGLCVVAGPARPMFSGGSEVDLEWDVTLAVLPWLVSAVVAGFGLVLVLRTDSAGSWLASRRYRVHTRRGAAGPAGSDRRATGEQAGGG